MENRQIVTTRKKLRLVEELGQVVNNSNSVNSSKLLSSLDSRSNYRISIAGIALL